MRVLLDRNADVNAREKAPTLLCATLLWSCSLVSSQKGTTPLYTAAQGGHVTVMRLLLGKGADVHAADEARAQLILPTLHLTRSYLLVAEWPDAASCNGCNRLFRGGAPSLEGGR